MDGTDTSWISWALGVVVFLLLGAVRRLEALEKLAKRIVAHIQLPPEE